MHRRNNAVSGLAGVRLRKIVVVCWPLVLLRREWEIVLMRCVCVCDRERVGGWVGERVCVIGFTMRERVIVFV